MAGIVSWSYNGSTTITAVGSGLAATTNYTLESNDPNSTIVNGNSDGSGNLTLLVTDVGGLSTGDTFDVEFFRTTGATDYISTIIFKIGTFGSGNLTLLVTDVGGLSTGDTFDVEFFRTTGATDYISTIIFKIGTSGSGN